MTTTIIIIAAILILGILLLLLRVQVLLSVMNGTYQKRVGKSNKVNGFLFLVFLIVGFIAFVWSYSSASAHFLPESASLHGLSVDKMFWVTMFILTLAFLITHFFIFFFAYKYQYSEDRKAYFYPENHKLEIVWTVIPAIVLSIMVFYGWKEWAKITSPAPKDSVVLEVMGRQFTWACRYPGPDGELGPNDFRLIDATNVFGLDFKDKRSLDDFAPTEIHIPKGKPVLFKIRSRDVIHSVFAPHFRLKMDAVPGMPTQFWFVPIKTTREMRDELGNPNFNYEIACAEVCGRGHFAMKYKIVVDEPEEFENWKLKQKSIAEVNADYVKGILAKNALSTTYESMDGSTDSTNAQMNSIREVSDTTSADSTLQKNKTSIDSTVNGIGNMPNPSDSSAKDLVDTTGVKTSVE